jgi:hypothetical protein
LWFIISIVRKKPEEERPMVRRLNISDEVQDVFQRMARLIPEQLRDDVQTQNSVCVFLKLGGEKTARQYIEIINMQFRKTMEEEVENTEVPDLDNSEKELYVSSQEDDDDQDSESDDELDDDDSDDDSEMY